MCLSYIFPDIVARIPLVSLYRQHVAVGRVGFQRRSDSQSGGLAGDLLALSDRRLQKRVLGTIRRLRVHYTIVRQHRRIRIRHYTVLQRFLDTGLRVWWSYSRHHDVYTRLFQHLVRGEGRMERVYEATYGCEQDQLSAGSEGRPARKAGRRLRDLLSGDAERQDHPM